MLLWLSDTLGTAAHIVKLLTVSLQSNVFRNVGWVGLGHASLKNHGLGWVGSICCGLGWVNKYGSMSISDQQGRQYLLLLPETVIPDLAMKS